MLSFYHSLCLFLILHLEVRWDPNQKDPLFFEQSALLWASYHQIRIIVHRPFIPMLKKPSLTALPSLEMCALAARSCCHVVDAYGKRADYVFPTVIQGAFTSGVYFLLSSPLR